MDESLTNPGIVLHVWPGQWGLPSFDPLCLSTVLYLQLAIPGKFTLKECSNPDVSPTGQLPFLVHERHVSTSFESIIKYVSALRESDYGNYENANLDLKLTPIQRSKKTAWFAHAESHLGNLVYYNLFANPDNWSEVTQHALASMFPVPQKYYVPRRIRDSYFPRLMAAGLWKHVSEEKPAEDPFPKEVRPLEKERLSKNSNLSLAFDKEKTLARARVELDIYRDLLDSHDYIFEQHLSSLDVLIAAHIIVLINPPVRDTLIKDFLHQSYPTLVSHAQRVYSIAFDASKPAITFASSSSSLWDLLPSPWPRKQSSQKLSSSSPEDVHYQKMRWGFFGLAVGSLVAYLVLVGRQVQIVWEVQDPNNPVDVPEDEKTEQLEVTP